MRLAIERPGVWAQSRLPIDLGLSDSQIAATTVRAVPEPLRRHAFGETVSAVIAARCYSATPSWFSYPYVRTRFSE